MRKPVLIFAMLSIALPLTAETPQPVFKKASKKKVVRRPASKKISTKTPSKTLPKAVSRRRSVKRPAVAVAPQVRRVAFQTVSERVALPASALEGAGALVPFFELISRPPENGSVHILQYGDSHTASDDWADTMRQAFQLKFGRGGPGFAFPGHPFLGYRRMDVKGNSSRGWYTDGLVGHKGDGIYGLGGVSLTATSAGETITLSAESEQLELHYLQHPGGGSLAFTMDGNPVDTISTAGALAPAVYQFAPPPGPHEYALRTLSAAPIRIFGWVAQNKSGVTYETLGINGASGGLLLDWDQTVLAGELAARDPALIVVAYGTNEALQRSWTAAAYHATFTQVIQRLRAAAPVASILIIGPPDCETRYRRQNFAFPHLADVIDVQRQVARENRCAFWDWRGRMGGPGSVKEWVQAGLSQGDYVHLTSTGYRLVGTMLFDEIMQQYNRFLAARAETSDGQ